ncbi:MAG: hypothetical protein J1F35_08115 [Erysipelotrichales bacterium]|nr:hypothetical protein [Erysipelotrichales bacterium]
MSTYTNALIHVWFSNETFDKKYKVEDFIRERNEDIESAKEIIQRLVWMTEPKKFCDDDESPEYYVSNNLKYALEELEKNCIDKYLAEKILEGWDYTHNENGEAIGEKDQDMDEMQRISGDFIKLVDKDGNSIYDENDF